MFPTGAPNSQNPQLVTRNPHRGMVLSGEAHRAKGLASYGASWACPCATPAREVFFWGVSRGGPREADAPRRSFDGSLSPGVLPMLAAAKLAARPVWRQGRPRNLSPVGLAAVGPLLLAFGPWTWD